MTIQRIVWEHDEISSRTKFQEMFALVSQTEAGFPWSIHKDSLVLNRGTESSQRKAEIRCETFLKQQLKLDKFNPWPSRKSCHVG